MDLGNKTLNGILKTIADENDLVGYNTYRNKRGRIVVKISYEEPSELDKKVDTNSEFNSNQNSFKKLSKNQSKRNFHRARNFRCQDTPESQNENSIEMPRNSEENNLSESTLNVLEVSHCIEDPCLSENPATRKPPPNSEHDLSCDEPFHDVSESPNCVTPELIGSNSSSLEPKAEKPPYKPLPLPERKPIYDKEKYESPWEHAQHPCDNTNCSFGPTPDAIDYSVVGISDPILRKCPHCDLIVCILCRKYRKIHRKYFIKPPPWD